MAQPCPARPRSAQPKDLGFICRPMVRWLNPGPLLTKGVKSLVAGLFGAYADKREMLGALKPPSEADHGDAEHVWVDYIADVGDGFDSTYTMAWLLSHPGLDLDDRGEAHATKRGDLLVLGGDAVYPAAAEDAYRDRFLGPYGAALPCTLGDDHPAVFAVPGNHDWYDGLTTFMRIFGQDHWVGGWRTRQSRSYFAVRLPGRWWLWGIDIQFDEYIDQPQLAYFTELGRTRLAPDDRIILCTAKPSWVHDGLEGDRAYTGALKAKRNLEFFEATAIRPFGARAAVMLSGDLHHYARYATEDGTSHKLTSGGGGAYLYPTHNLPERVGWPGGDAATEVHQLRATYPDRPRSRRLRAGCLLAPFKNPGFWMLSGAIDIVFAWLIQASLQGRGGATTSLREASFATIGRALLREPGSLALAVVLAAALISFADASSRPRKLLLGAPHAAAQLALVLVAVWAGSRADLPWPWFWVVGLAIVGLAGGLAGGLVMGLYLFVCNALFGRHPNEAFASQHIQDYKGFLRLRIDRDGSLTIFPIGVEQVCRTWRLPSQGAEGDPWFEPDGDPPRPFLIEPPVRVR